MIANATPAGLRRLLSSLLLVATACAAPAHAATPLGAPFTVTQDIGSDPTHALARSASGSFVVAWVESRIVQGVIRGEVLLRRYSANGSALGAAFPADPGGALDLYGPALAADPSGGFVAVWGQIAPDEPPNRAVDYYAQRFSASGARVGSVQHVAHVVDYNLPPPAVAMNVDGSYVVAWQAFAYHPLIPGVSWVNLVTTNVYARQYGSDGLPRAAAIKVDAELPVNANLAGYPHNVDVGVDASGAFAVAYEVVLGASSSIQLRRYNADGSARGLRVRVSQLASFFGIQPSLLMNADGSSVVAWSRCQHPGNPDCENFFQRFGANGAKQGAIAAIANPASGIRPTTPKLAGGPNGSFLAVWQVVQGGGGKGLGQAYHADGSVDGAVFMLQTDAMQHEVRMNVASDASGGFVATWLDLAAGSGEFIYGLKGRRFLRQ
ncbi:hypothetical protein D0B54_09380 [Solimonas sp. K1W22B-7]|uniref:hypothetical protein n=1 Tax=Solimonas sp. K1W22B-7 TaxID=2303331 RepID=UPI000E32DCA2|nr:hypothetical protein [Solimonas sp. K1W22B-7]AXQ28882.1 hypothetical protein D0B54_09380 [Solimonas sp. K1W22B-7]